MKFITLFALVAIAQLKLAQAGSTPFCTKEYYSPKVCKKFEFPRGIDCNPIRGPPFDVDVDHPAQFTSQRAYEFAVGISNVFENSQAQIDYATCEPIGDGRGYTCGSGGYTSDDGSMQDPLVRYGKILKEKNLSNPFEKFMPIIHDIANNSGCSPYRGTVKPLRGIGKIWTNTACTDKLFRQAQDEAVAAGIDHWSMSHAAFYNIKTNFGLAVFRDTMEMHGDGTGEPLIGLEKIGRLTKKALGDKPFDEKKFIAKFLQIRRQMQCCYRPKDSHGKGDTTWAEAADRIDDLQRILKTGNWDLKPPIKLVNYGPTLDSDFNLYATPKECKHIKKIKTRCLDPSDTTTFEVNGTHSHGHDKDHGASHFEIPASNSSNFSASATANSTSSVPNYAGRNRVEITALIFSFLSAVAWLFI